MDPTPTPPSTPLFGAEKAPQSWSWENGNPKNAQSKCFSGVRQYDFQNKNKLTFGN